MSHLDIIVIGASAGGVGSLQRLVERLPAGFPAAVFIALHLPDGVRSLLPQILQRAGALPAGIAENGAPIERGRIYIAPPGYHLTLECEGMRVTRGAREHGHRPAIDPLFRSAALVFGPRVIGVILSGLLDDGTVGLIEVKRAGGIAVVQDPADTPFPSMPRSAIAHVEVDYVVPADQIGGILEQLVMEKQSRAHVPNGDDTRIRGELRALTTPQDERDAAGNPSPYSCPECGGVLWELKDAQLGRFRCRVGHAYNPDSLTAEQAAVVEQSLWTALRALEEQAGVKRRMADRFKRQGQQVVADQIDRRVRELEEHSQRIRELLFVGVGANEEVKAEG